MMEPFIKLLLYLIPLTLTVAIEYRFSRRILEPEYSGKFIIFIMLAVQCLAGQLNVRFHISKDIGGNALYYSIMTLGFYLFLFKGHVIKKIFLTVLIICGFPITFYIFLPFAHYFFIQDADKLILSLNALEYANLLLCAAGLEYVGRKFQNLRRELPLGYTFYLTAVILFVYVAVYSAYDRTLIMKDGVISPADVLIAFSFAVFGVVIVVIAIFAVDRQVDVSLREQLHMIQAENFKSRELEWRKFSGFRHDIKNHLICLSSLLENGKTDQALSYMSNLTDTVKQFDSPVQTGNDYADALLSVKYAEAAAADITVSLDMAIPSQGFIEPVDLCCILSNAFDNAIAACCRLTEGEKWITARAFIRQEQLVIIIKNSRPPYVTVVNGNVFPKEVTADHGLGLDTVKSVVKKYDGILSLSADEAFTFSVLLPPLHSWQKKDRL